MSAMRLLGLGCGEASGSAEILLDAALMAAEHAGVEVALARLDDLRIPGIGAGAASAGDNGPWFWDQLMESDGLIVSAPIYNRTVPGKLRLLCDRVLGPNADVAFATEYLRMRQAGEAPAVAFPVDERLLRRDRVAGFIAVGGSLTPHWKTLALPLMHTLTFSMQIGVVDQVQFAGAGSPASIVLDEPAIERAELLGRNVADQIGRRFDDVEYKGEPGLCPMCHLSVIVVGEAGVECATCGARGRFVVDGGDVSIEFPRDGREQSVITYAEKRAHFTEVQETAARLASRRDEIHERARRFENFDRLIRP
jgi:multimeric flavodoxin WrbA